MIASSFVHTLRQRVVLSSVVSPWVRLIKRGKLLLGLCPFHQEKTPSFSVDDGRGTFHCFGCGIRGDIIDFVRQQQRLTFSEAVASLASKAGLSLPTQKIMRNPLEKDLYKLLERACRWFQEVLLQTPQAMAYLMQRGVTPDEIRLYRLGWAPARGLLDQAHGWGYTSTLLEEGGLVWRREEDQTLVERFRNRILFPIQDAQQRVVAFGGRSLGKEGPKYINSPETVLFHKGKNLYGSLSCSRASTFSPTQRPSFLVVEGYLDVILAGRSHRVMAPLGTAITEVQLLQLWKQDPEPVVCFDGDRAGQDASYRLAIMALPLLQPGYSLWFACLPQGHDPHSLLQTEGEESFAQKIQRALPLWLYLWHRLFQNSVTPEQKAKAAVQWKEWISTISSPDVRVFYRQFFYRSQKQQKPIPAIPSLSVLAMHQKILIGMLLLHPSLVSKVREELAAMAFPKDSPWLHIRNFLLSWESGELFLELETFLGSRWKEQLAVVERHMPSDPCSLESYWRSLFNAYQIHLYQKEELLSLGKELMAVPGAWDRLRVLTTINHEMKQGEPIWPLKE